MRQKKSQEEILQELIERKNAVNAIAGDPSLTFINEKELSAILNVALGTLRRQRWAGTGIRFHKFSGACRYKLADVQQYIKETARTSTSDHGAAHAA